VSDSAPDKTYRPEASSGRYEQVALRREVASVAMTKTHRGRLERRIRSEIRGTHQASLWVALSFGFAGVAGTLLVPAFTAIGLVSGSREGVEVAGWAAAFLAVFCIFVHFMTRQSADKRADDFLDEVNSYMVEVVITDTETKPVKVAAR
jgi:hypothetical protein